MACDGDIPSASRSRPHRRAPRNRILRHAVSGRRELGHASGDGVPSNQPFRSVSERASRWLPFLANSSKHQFGTSMPQGGHPPHHSITSSARASSVGGTSRPSALAVCRLMTNSNFVDWITGRSAGLAPLRI
jgi:hypothetical protein